MKWRDLANSREKERVRASAGMKPSSTAWPSEVMTASTPRSRSLPAASARVPARPARGTRASAGMRDGPRRRMRMG